MGDGLDSFRLRFLSDRDGTAGTVEQQGPQLILDDVLVLSNKITQNGLHLLF